MQIIAFVIAFCVWYLGSTDDYKKALKLWKGGDDAKYAWAFLTAVVYAYLVIWLNVFGMHFKERVIRQGNLRANMFLYRPVVGGDDNVSAVTLYEEGDKGKYNRANRSLYHFLENHLSFLVCLPGSLLIFPFPTFVIVVLAAVGRIVYQTGYTLGGFMFHLPGFMLDRIMMFTLIAFNWVCFFKAMFPEDEESMTGEM